MYASVSVVSKFYAGLTVTLCKYDCKVGQIILVNFCKMFLLFWQVALIFLPRQDGDYSQFWDLECHPVEKPSWKHKLRFQLCGVVSI